MNGAVNDDSEEFEEFRLKLIQAFLDEYPELRERVKRWLLEEGGERK